MFLEATEDAALQNHSIRTIVPSVSENFCRVQCYLENECVSYNYGQETCQLNNSTAAEHPLDLKAKPNFIYRGIQVNEEFLSHIIARPSIDCLNVRPPFWKKSGIGTRGLRSISHSPQPLFTFIIQQVGVNNCFFWKVLIHSCIASDLLCLFLKNSCTSMPCLNHGTCQSVFDPHGYRCFCTAGFTGTQCDKGRKR